MWSRKLAMWLLRLSAALCLTQSMAVAQSTNIFEFSIKDPISLDAIAGREERVEIQNVDPNRKEHQFKVRLSDLGLKNIKGQSLTNARFIKVEPESGGLKSLESLQLRIALTTTPESSPGVYHGNLFVEVNDKKSSQGGTQNQPISRPVKITVRGLEPLVDKLTVKMYRKFPALDYWLFDENITLKRPISASIPAEGTLLGGVRREEGGSAAVFAGTSDALSNDKLPTLNLAVKGVEHAGKYEGKIKLNSAGSAAGDVDLTVEASDIVIWPIAVLGLSIWLALRVKRFVNVGRAILELREREAGLGEKFRESQQHFAQVSTGKPYAAYTIAADLNSRRQALRKKIDALSLPSAAPAQDNPAYKEILKELEQLERHMLDWKAFANELNRLEAALEISKSSFNSHPPGSSETPAFWSEARRLLAGKPLTLDEVADCLEEVFKANALAPVLNELETRVETVWGCIKELEPHKSDMTETQVAQLEEAKLKASEAWSELWRIKSDADLSDFSTKADLLTAEQYCAQLNYLLGESNAAKFSMPSMWSKLMGEDDLSGTFNTRRALLEGGDDDAARRQFFARIRNRWERRLAIFAFIIALLTGLSQFYFTAPFGTLHDYIKIFLWGLGTKAAVDVITASLEWAFSRRPPLTNLSGK